mgnify:FL=1
MVAGTIANCVTVLIQLTTIINNNYRIRVFIKMSSREATYTNWCYRNLTFKFPILILRTIEPKGLIKTASQ